MKTKTIVAGFLGLALSATMALPVAAQTTVRDDSTDGISDHNVQDGDGRSKGVSKGTHKGAMGKGSMSHNSSEFKMMDTNGDGTISHDEYMAYHQGHWDKMDSGKTGSVTADRYRSYSRSSQQMMQNRSDGSVGAATPSARRSAEEAGRITK